MKLRLLVSETTHTDLDIEGFVSRPIDAKPAVENWRMGGGCISGATVFVTFLAQID